MLVTNQLTKSLAFWSHTELKFTVESLFLEPSIFQPANHQNKKSLSYSQSNTVISHSINEGNLVLHRFNILAVWLLVYDEVKI